VFDEFVVTNVVSIDSENVTEIDVLVETEVSPLDGEVEETVGGVVSVEVLSVEVVGSKLYVLSFFPHETTIRHTGKISPNSKFLIVL
jgi:hypothetical protein